MAGLVRLLKQKWFPPADPVTSFKGKNVIITGSNVGLGFEAAVKYVALDAARVIIAVRTIEKGNAAKKAIEARTGKTGIVEVWLLEMSSYESIKSFAEKAAELDHLDVAILNAGVMSTVYQQSSYGWETTLQINTLSTTLLALLLLPALRKSSTPDSKPVLEIVSSGFYRTASIPPEHATAPLAAYNDPKAFSAQPQYGRSKLFVQCTMKEISKLVQAKNYADPPIIVTSVCPGACKSDLGRGFTHPMIKLLLPVIHFLFFRSTEVGSRTLVSGTTQGKEAHGLFWKNDMVML
jgi:NAD(P)-dependent dehydrogenase (short-subunit alcohol dehydrogenase family)